MYANSVGYVLSNQLVMLCVDDELLCLCLLSGFISHKKIQCGMILHYLAVNHNSQ